MGKGKFKRYWGRTSWMDLNEKSLGIPATSWEMIIKACSLDENLKLKMSIYYNTGAIEFWSEKIF